jgi:hypothetical protein
MSAKILVEGRLTTQDRQVNNIMYKCQIGSTCYRIKDTLLTVSIERKPVGTRYYQHVAYDIDVDVAKQRIFDMEGL